MQAGRAKRQKNLFVNQLNIIMDFGEVARSVYPHISLPFHEYGKKILEDPVLYQVGENPLRLFAQLQMSEGQVYLETKAEKQAWVEYQLALDYLALERLKIQTEIKEKHKLHMEKALSLDPAKTVYPIYADQLSILDRLLPR